MFRVVKNPASFLVIGLRLYLESVPFESFLAFEYDENQQNIHMWAKQ